MCERECQIRKRKTFNIHQHFAQCGVPSGRLGINFQSTTLQKHNIGKALYFVKKKKKYKNNEKKKKQKKMISANHVSRETH